MNKKMEFRSSYKALILLIPGMAYLFFSGTTHSWYPECLLILYFLIIPMNFIVGAYTLIPCAYFFIKHQKISSPVAFILIALFLGDLLFYAGYLHDTKQLNRTFDSIHALAGELEKFKVNHNDYPETLDVIQSSFRLPITGSTVSYEKKPLSYILYFDAYFDEPCSFTPSDGLWCSEE